jgi:hypothetical protein
MRAARWLLGAAGVAVMAYAVVGALGDDGVDKVGVAWFLLALVVAHDLVLLPVAIGVGALVVKGVPEWARPSVQSGLFASAIVTAVAFPLVIGAGVIADNPSRLPLNYGRGLAVVLAVVWGGAALSALRARPRRPPGA